jgi:hypothetical protein
MRILAKRLRSRLVLALVAVLVAGCADPGVKQMVAKPKPFATEGANSAERRVVLFRAVVDIEGASMEEPWSLHFNGLGLYTIVGPQGANLASARSFLPGRPNAVASDEGWAFLALPPGTYQLLFEGTAIQFALAGARYFGSEAVPVGRSPPSVFAVPPDAGLIYIGTFNFTCHEPTSRPDALKAECTRLEIRDETQLARQIAQTSFSSYGPLREGLASAPEAKSAR